MATLHRSTTHLASIMNQQLIDGPCCIETRTGRYNKIIIEQCLSTFFCLFKVCDPFYDFDTACDLLFALFNVDIDLKSSVKSVVETLIKMRDDPHGGREPQVKKRCHRVGMNSNAVE